MSGDRLKHVLLLSAVSGAVAAVAVAVAVGWELALAVLAVSLITDAIVWVILTRD